MEEDKNKKEEKTILGYIRGYKKIKDDTPKAEARPEYRENKAIKTWKYNDFVLIVLIFSVILVVVVLVYVVYAFFHGSRLASMSGINLTNNFKEAYYQILDKKPLSQLGTEPGYAGWLIYRDNSLELKYPGDWKLKTEGGLAVRKFNLKLYGYFDSLAVDVSVKKFENPENLEMTDFLKKNNLKIGENKQRDIPGGKTVSQTGIYKDQAGLTREALYWVQAGKVVYVEAVFYNNNYGDYLKDLDKIIQSIKIF
jgi:hypothetical protein